MVAVYVVLNERRATNGMLMGAVVDSVWRSYDKAAERVDNLLNIGEDPYINVQIMDD